MNGTSQFVRAGVRIPRKKSLRIESLNLSFRSESRLQPTETCFSRINLSPPEGGTPNLELRFMGRGKRSYRPEPPFSLTPCFSWVLDIARSSQTVSTVSRDHETKLPPR